MKRPYVLILLAGFLLAFRPDERIEPIVKNYTFGKLGKIESYQLLTVDTLTPRTMLALHQSRINDSLTVLQPILNALNKQYEDCSAAYKKYPSDKFFKDNLARSERELGALKGWLGGMIRRSDSIDTMILQADSMTFLGFITKSAVKYYQEGNRAFTVYDTATVVVDRDYRVIEKESW